MTFFVECETDIVLEGIDDPEAVLRETAGETLRRLDCPYEASVSLTLTDGEEIRRLNRQFRDIDAVTDVLSFPLLDFECPGDFSGIREDDPECFDPETGELTLGDIVINLERVISQAADYGHSQRREFAFLIVHSVLHLLGFDHETASEEGEMFSLQEEILNTLGYVR
ncbi:MAG: rRNA maturation RNase YbeY [Lachnospiraceae bacterium]|nr:rRNA maturation RNase YbeY [Lachnospiraceae bacterium]